MYKGNITEGHITHVFYNMDDYNYQINTYYTVIMKHYKNSREFRLQLTP